jgi:hypothetical protein
MGYLDIKVVEGVDVFCTFTEFWLEIIEGCTSEYIYAIRVLSIVK